MTDTSDAAVERELSLLACRRAGAGDGDTAWDLWAERTERLIRALVAERDAARAECERLRLGGCARGQITTQWCAEAVEMMAQRDAARRAARAFGAETAKAHENSKRWRSERDTWQRIAMDAAQRLMLAETERDTASTSDDEDAITAEDEDRAFLGSSDEDDDE